MNLQQARQMPVGITAGQVKALTDRWKYSPQEISGLNKETASELLDACSRAGHKLDGEDYAAFKEAEALQDRSAIEKRGFLAPVIIDRSLDRLFSDLPAKEKEDEYELRQELKQVNKTMSEAAEYLGRVLTAYKETLPYKKWLPFLDLIGITPRSAQRYMELASIKKDLGPDRVKELEDKGIHLTLDGSKNGLEARQIARKVIEKTNDLLNKQSTCDIHVASEDQPFSPQSVISQEQHEQFITESIQEVRQSEVRSSHSSPELPPQIADTPEARERRIAAFEISLKEDMTGLRGAYRDDDAFRAAVGRIYRSVTALHIPAKETINAA
jgi:hypothetical protein